jgi:tetratricopeptide (TPR) repeat protein
MSLPRTARLAAGAFVLAVALFLTAAIVSTRGGSQATLVPQGRTAPASPIELSNPGDLSATIDALQSRLRRLPTDSASWASLGAAYIQQARVTGDPSFYAKAGGVLRRSLRENPDDNAVAITGQAALAAARHDFGRALRLARTSQNINPYSSVNQGMLVDALVELGRYPLALRAAQRMVDLKPAVPSYTRVSYLYELRGDLRGARFAMRRALAVAYSDDDKAFALFELGELAWNAGDLDRAGRLYRRGLALDPSYVPLLYGTAKVEAAQGEAEHAVEDFQTVVDRYPSPAYVIEYADLLKSLGRHAEAARQAELIRAQQQLFESAGVNLDLELALYDADHGQPREALTEARRAFADRQGVFVEDAFAWALHVNGRDMKALAHARQASRLGTRSALLTYHRGAIERSLGMRAAAEASLRRALTINPHFSPILAPRARAILAILEGRSR